MVWYEEHKDDPSPPPLVPQYDAAAAAKVQCVMRTIGLTPAQVERECKSTSKGSALSLWLQGKRTSQPSVAAAGAAAIAWAANNKHRAPLVPPYDAAAAAKVHCVMRTIGLNAAEVERECKSTSKSGALSQWLQGKRTSQPGVAAAGAAAIAWAANNKNRAPLVPPYDAAAAAKVKVCMGRLGLSAADVERAAARELGAPMAEAERAQRVRVARLEAELAALQAEAAARGDAAAAQAAPHAENAAPPAR